MTNFEQIAKVCAAHNNNSLSKMGLTQGNGAEALTWARVAGGILTDAGLVDVRVTKNGVAACDGVANEISMYIQRVGIEFVLAHEGETVKHFVIDWCCPLAAVVTGLAQLPE
jgi:hypothetical protein